ncbi:hypothetical protein DV711_11145 [Motiliproteus coralliicola]|uniref:Uncharacterized protein n=1 Tax=Motiliproteus coralliicola TaxID=2283196 RepID=A0A369WDS2_9GAMM|nr:hypothetical protein [Motiliproteus coralliicola]RDE19443.1 hypothetical protein DV711_11145 [Motiliproteus coralliicola]
MNGYLSSVLLTKLTTRLLFGFTLIGGGLFVTLSKMEHLGLGGAGEPERWALGRVLSLIGWWLLAVGLYFLRRRQAYRQSLIIIAWLCGLISVALATLWSGMTSGFGIYLSALFYTLLCVLWGMTIQHHLWAGLFGVVILLLQIATDIVVLGILGEFRIH